LDDTALAAAKSARLRRRVIAGLVSIAVLAVTTAIYAYSQRQDAVNQRNQVIYSSVSLEANQLSGTDPSLAGELALAGYQMDPAPNFEAMLFASENSWLSTPLAATRYYWSAAFSPDGSVLAAAD